MTEPIEYKEFEDKFFMEGDRLVSQSALNYGSDIPQAFPAEIKRFIKANFIAKSEIKEAIEKTRINLSDKVRGDDFAGKYALNEVKKHEWSYNQALSDLKSTLKLDE